MKSPVFEHISLGGKLVLLLGLVIVFAMLFSLVGLLIGKWYLDVNLSELASVISNPEGKALKFSLFFQFLSQLGVFIVPTLVFGLFVSQCPRNYLKLNKKPTVVSLGIVTMAVYAVLPFINYLSEVNHLIHLTPAIDDWIMMKETQAQQITEAFLATDSLGRLILNLLIMALIPALGEEMLFRGVLQRLLAGMMKNIHFAIIVAAFLFSAFHLQFLGFLPRFILGIMLGYAFVMTGSLWTAIWLHFVNNASSVIVYYLYYNGYIKVSMDNFGQTQNTVYIIGSLLMTIWLFIMMYNKEGADIWLKYFEKE